MDQLIDRVTRLVHDYTEQGPLTLTEVLDGDRAHTTVTAIAPIPEVIPRLIADALTQLRAALEHTVYAEVEHLLERPLTDQEAHCIDMPACTETRAFETWLAHGRRRTLAPLAASAPLVKRIRTLQPFERRDFEDHPLRLLAMHTNLAKHRTPAVAATRLGAIHTDRPHEALTVALPLQRNPQPGHGLPLRPGDILASGPRYARIEISIFSTVSLQRPHTGKWAIALKELGYLEDWVRTTAIPILITGSRQSTPIPPGLDITVGHIDLRHALRSADTVTAAERGNLRLMAAQIRLELPEILSMPPSDIGAETIRAWISSLDDSEVLSRMARLQAASYSSAMLRYIEELRSEARVHQKQAPR
ncbi:hypothetical protein [Streptomyces sp. NPDC020965]|uniref:hypothetical protein n=1 Tax=Streptomyces sp. NPDC020965 TaxID=3365105 RepID=UPI0037A3DCDE